METLKSLYLIPESTNDRIMAFSAINGDTIDLNFICKVLICMTLSEYRIDSLLLHPAEMRFSEIKDLSLSIGLPEDTLKKIYFNWHSSIRKKIFHPSEWIFRWRRKWDYTMHLSFYWVLWKWKSRSSKEGLLGVYRH